METLNADAIVASVMAALNNYPGRSHPDSYVVITNDLDLRLSDHRVARDDCLRIFVPRTIVRRIWTKVHSSICIR